MTACKITNKGDLWKSYQSTGVLLSIYDSISTGNYERFGSPMILEESVNNLQIKKFPSKYEKTIFVIFS